ncbi:MAG: lysoplasmalogenase [Spirochaetota bacterium]
MVTVHIPLATMLVALAFLLRAEFRPDQRRIWIFKPIASISFIAIGVVGAATAADASDEAYRVAILVGLVLCAVGDVFLIPADNKRAFTFGLVSFLLGHLAYSLAFILVSAFQWVDLLVAVPLIGVIAVLYRRFTPNLGSMRVPVAAYMVAISFMVSRGAAVVLSGGVALTGAWLALGGALAFYGSDVMLAWNRYATAYRLNRLNLVLYYGGQAAIAASVMFAA